MLFCKMSIYRLAENVKILTNKARGLEGSKRQTTFGCRGDFLDYSYSEAVK
jgi:hypothetical protein